MEQPDTRSKWYLEGQMRHAPLTLLPSCSILKISNRKFIVYGNVSMLAKLIEFHFYQPLYKTSKRAPDDLNEILFTRLRLCPPLFSRNPCWCLAPCFDGVILSREWKETLWDRDVIAAPRPGTPCEQYYSDCRLRSWR